MLKRKLRISPGRKEQLAAARYYEIRCGLPDCLCTHAESYCERGFFSLFIQAINGILFAKHFGLDPWINFGGINYLFSDPGEKDANFWNYYFLQDSPPSAEHIVANRLFETYPLRIWHRTLLRKMNKEGIAELNFRPEVKQLLDKSASQVRSRSTLGIHWRGTDHHLEVPPAPLARLQRLIRKKLKHYDQLFVATDEQNVLEVLQQEFGGKVVHSGATRSASGQAVHRDPGMKNKRQLGLEVIKDVYTMAHCKEVILTHSNVSYAVLLFNPEIPYTLLERRSMRWMRWKTILVYLLDRWGIR